MEENRRPVASRKVSFFQSFAKKLVELGLTPNQISVMSVVFASIGGFCLSKVSSAEGISFYVFVFISLLGIQLRFICNLIDGLMAIEGGLKTPTGELYNDIPDRFSDLVLILGAACNIPFSWGMNLGWIAATFAILTAYVRVLGASMQKGHDFGGPMAKQHRMFLLNLVVVAAVVEKMVSGQIVYSFAVGILFLAVGSFATVVARISRLSGKLG